MDIGIISVRYARALLKSALDAKLDQQVYQEMQLLAKSFVEVPELRHTIDNPMLAKDKKEMLLLTAIGGDGASALSKAFVALVLKEDRENMIQFMANSYVTMLIGANSEQLMLDVQGRIRISDKLLQFANLTTTVVMAGSVRMAKLWNPEAYAEESSGDLADFNAALDMLEA